MPLPAFDQVLTLRPEVLDPSAMVTMVDLSYVSGGGPRGRAAEVPGAEILRDPAAFFEITWPSGEIVQTLQALSSRFTAPERVPGTILLSGRYGLGKSHVLLAAHHALSAPAVAQAWARRWGLGELPLPPSPVVITRSFIQHSAQPLWETLIAALAGRQRPRFGDYPDGELIEGLVGNRQVFLVLDELERWYDAQDALTQSRTRNFVQALTEVSMRSPRLTVLTSVLGEKPEPAETIRRVRPLELAFRSASDRQAVVLFRLFADRDRPEARRAATDVAHAAVATWKQAGIPNTDALLPALLGSWPFTPEFLEILTARVPQLGGFQNTRGVLRFLSHVVRAARGRRALISSQDVPLDDNDARNALTGLDSSGGEIVRRALGDNRDAVPAALKHRDELFSAILLYSLADPTRPGATRDQLLLATLDPGENPNEILDALRQLRGLAFNLHEEDDRYLFKAVENPHARINAMANAEIIGAAWRAHILAALHREWGAPAQTAVFELGEQDALSRRLRELRGQRPRYLLSTVSLSPRRRLELQNLDEARNLVLLIEPRVRTSDGAPGQEIEYNLFNDEALRQSARRVEACRLLLEGRPAPDSARVYREVHDRESARLRQLVRERYGVYIAWNRAGASGAPVDESWYEVAPIDDFGAAAFRKQLERNHSSLPEIAFEVRRLWSSWLHQKVQGLVDHFERTPGLPVPLDAGQVERVVLDLARERALGLVGPDGRPVTGEALAALGPAELRAATLTEATREPEGGGSTRALLTHPRANAGYDQGIRGVRVQWTWPAAAPDRAGLRTLVQRYGSARGWEEGQVVQVSLDQTHDANRYHGEDDGFVDTERLVPGEWYHYYVFLEQQGPEGRPVFVLSRRLDVGVPRPPDPERADLLKVGPCPDRNRLIADTERLVMNPRTMSPDARVRKLVVRVRGVSDPQLRGTFAKELGERIGDALELSADLCFTARGDWSRQDLLNLIRQLPRLERASYEAELHLKPQTRESA